MDDRGQRDDRPGDRDPDGVRIVPHAAGSGTRTMVMAIAALLVLAAGAWWWFGRGGSAPPARGGSLQAGDPSSQADVAGRLPASAPNGQPDHAVAAQPGQAQRDPNDLASYIAPGQPEPTMGEVIATLREHGIRTGIGAFNPPGTSPPLVGIAVPEDVPLPEGYVRHHQVTDDGQPIEAILMFSPDHEFHDAAGRPIDIPEDRVVPPHLVPPGLPIRRIVIPPPLPPGTR